MGSVILCSLQKKLSLAIYIFGTFHWPFKFDVSLLYAIQIRLWQDEEAFFRDYAESHKKLSELGFTSNSSGSKVISKESGILAPSAVGVAVAAAVVILSYFYEVHKNIK